MRLTRPLLSDCAKLLVVIVLGGFAPFGEAAEPTAEAARPYLLRGHNRRLLDSVVRLVDAEQWDDALDLLLRLIDLEDDSVVSIADHRFVSLQNYCHRLITRLPPTTLARYRAQVDPLAETWFRQGIADRDVASLQRVVDEAFCSSWGDDALLALGEFALSRGEYQKARLAWSRLSPTLRRPEDESLAWFYPDTTHSLADLRARLVLISIREGDQQRAERELRQMIADYPDARGQLGGRSVVYAEYLATLLQQSRQWPPRALPKEWPTFAGNSARTAAISGPATSAFQQKWSIPLGLLVRQELLEKSSALTTFPILVGKLVFYRNTSGISGLDLETGERKIDASNTIFRYPSTFAAAGEHLFGVTNLQTTAESVSVSGSLWGIDLNRDAAFAFRQEAEPPGTIFAGAPVVDDSQLVVELRSEGRTTRAGIAGHDLITGERRWQRWLCQADVPIKNLPIGLPTLNAGIVYTCTNSGAIAALRSHDGALLWLRTYAGRSQVVRDRRRPSPPIYGRGILFVAPVDSQKLWALDAATGSTVWQHRFSSPQARLVGLADGRLLISDDGLHVFDARSGDLIMSNDHFKLRGTPVTIAQTVYWPTDKEIQLIDIATGKIAGLPLRLPESGGANLAVAGAYLVAAGPARLTVFRDESRRFGGSPISTRLKTGE